MVAEENRPLGQNKLPHLIMKEISAEARRKQVPHLHQHFDESNSDNPVGQRWINRSTDYGNFLPPQ